MSFKIKKSFISVTLFFFLLFSYFSSAAFAEITVSNSDGTASASCVIGGVLNIPQDEPDYVITIPAEPGDSIPVISNGTIISYVTPAVKEQAQPVLFDWLQDVCGKFVQITCGVIRFLHTEI